MPPTDDPNTTDLNLTEVDEESAPAAVQTTFEEIRAVLRVPFVDQLWRVLARNPKVLGDAWRRVAPALGTLATERAADALRRVAVIEPALGLPSHKAFRGDMSRAEISAEERERISNYTAAMHYVLPKLLLAAALLIEPEGDGATAAPEPLPRGVDPRAPRVEPLPPDVPWGEIPGLFAAIRERHGYQPIADYYRSIARAGDFLRLAWNPLRPIVGDPEYYDRARAVTARALQEAGRLPRISGAPAAHLTGGAERIVDFYLHRLLPETLIEVTIVKGLTDGPDAAAHSPYSLTERVVRSE